MLEFLIPLLISTVLGFLAGMGVGAGSLLLLWLTQIVELPQDQAKILNLLFFLPAAIVATIFHRKQKNTQPNVIWPGIIAGCLAAVLASFFARTLNLELMKKMLGGLLILTGLREIFYRPRKAR